ncbi:MAG: hypothetical protein AB1422_10670 [bacterium]
MKETKHSEFKKSTGEWKEIVETVSAFSNTEEEFRFDKQICKNAKIQH